MNSFDFDRCTKALRVGLFAAIATLALMSFASTTAFAQDDPRPVRPTCEERCAEKATKLLERCIAGEGENCEARAEEFQANCEARCATAGERPTCGERCQRAADQLEARCEASGGKDCAGKAEAYLERCNNLCTRLDDARARCATGCEDRAAAHRERCDTSGGGDECLARVERALKHCLHRCENVGPRRIPGPGPRDPGPRDPGPRDPGEPPVRPGRP